MEHIVAKFGQLALVNAVEGLTWHYVRGSGSQVEVSQLEQEQEELKTLAQTMNETELNEKYDSVVAEAIRLLEMDFDEGERENPTVQEYMAEKRQAAKAKRFRGWAAAWEYLQAGWAGVNAADMSVAKRLQWIVEHSAASLLSDVLLDTTTITSLTTYESDDCRDGRDLLGDALLLAAEAGREDLIQLIVSVDPSLLVYVRTPPQATTCSGYMAIHFACDLGNSAAVSVILESAREADMAGESKMLREMMTKKVFSRVPVPTGGGVRALHLAANSLNLAAVRTMLQAATPQDASAAEMFGRTPVEIAFSKACNELVEDSVLIQIIESIVGAGGKLPEDAREIIEDEGLEDEPRTSHVLDLVAGLSS